MYVVLKNPISLTYFRLSRAHFSAAQRFDGKTPLGEIAAALQAEDRYWRALPLDDAVTELGQLAGQLGSLGVIQTTGRGALRRVNAVHERRGKVRFDALIGSILYIKKSLFDPNRLLGRMDPWFRWMFTPRLRAGVLRGGGCDACSCSRAAGRTSPRTRPISSPCKTWR